jgi:hypothetical protein
MSARPIQRHGCLLPEGDVDLLGSQIEPCVLGLTGARHDERIQTESNTVGTPAANSIGIGSFDVVDDQSVDGRLAGR